ncbi:MAG: pyrrolo-quinoline quinone [Planctomycetes bacterium]|nr:pyrrolo-quinoline quinone [Planctomycetota bacterium]
MTHLWRGACAACLLACSTRADDWPQWLGPERDSVWREMGILKTFPDGGAKVLWRQPIGSGFAGPAVAGGRVFVTDYVTEQIPVPSAGRRDRLNGRERILCFSAGEGKLLWKYEYERPYHISYASGPRVTPTVDGDRVYALGAEGNLVCLRSVDGTLVWARDLPADYDFETPQWGFSGHPLVDGNKLICLVGGNGSIAVAFDKQTGKELWRALSAKEPGYCPPTLIEAGKTRQLLIWHSDALNSLDPESGKLYWSEPIDASWGMAIAAPRRDGPFLFVGAIVMKSMLVRLDANRPAAEVVWTGRKGIGIAPTISTPFLENGHMYGVDREGELRCVKLETGEQLWSTYDATTPGQGLDNASAFLVKHEDRFFIFNERGELVIAKMSPDGYEPISRAKIIEPNSNTVRSGREDPIVWSHPAFAQRCVFARNDNELVCVSLAAE